MFICKNLFLKKEVKSQYFNTGKELPDSKLHQSYENQIKSNEIQSLKYFNAKSIKAVLI